MDAGGVQVQHLPSNEDPTRQPWRNSSPNGDQGKQRRENGGKARPKAINVERAQSYNSKTAVLPGAAPIKTPKTPSKSSQQQIYVPPKVAFSYAKSIPQPMNLSRSPPQATSSVSSPPQVVAFPSRSPPNMSFGGDVSLPNNTVLSQSKQKSASSTRPTPKPLNLSKSSSQNLGRVPLTATFPKTNKFVNLPQPPKTATFPKPSSGFPKDYRQTAARMSQTSPPFAFVYGDQTYIQAVPESPRPRRPSATSTPFRLVNYRQSELGPGTPVVVLSQPEDSDSQESSPPTPCYLPEGYSDAYDLYNIGGYDGEENDDSQFYYYYYDYPQDYVLQTPTGTSHRANASKDQRRRSVLSGTMRVHPDAIVPIRQPKGPDMTKNFATRIRRQAVSKLFAAAAERRSKSTADRRKSTMF